MNWLVLVFLAILAINIYQGYKKGFLRVALSLVSWIVVILVSNALAPQLTEIVISETSIDETIIHALNNAITETVENINIEQYLPSELKALLPEENISLSLEGILVQDMVQTEKILPYIFGAVQILCTIILLLVMRIVLFLADKILAIASHLPLIGPADKFLGLAVGIAKGILLTWILMTILTLFAMVNGNFSVVTMIYDSKILTWLYENNLVLNFIMNL